MSTSFSRFGWLSASLFATAALWSCGGTVVADPGAGGTGTGASGGEGGTATSTATSTSTSTSTSGGAGGAVSSCPKPHPQPCGAITACPCLDGTTQVGGCANGFTCPEACCGHGGSK